MASPIARTCDEIIRTKLANGGEKSFMNQGNNFPHKFQDFFSAFTDDSDDLPSMPEDKLIPRKQETPNSDAKTRRWSKRVFQRRSSEAEVRLHRSGLASAQGHASLDGPKSPTPSRQRSSSIAVMRPAPDMHRFRQAELGPWGLLSPSGRSPTRTPARSPGAESYTSHHSLGASPGGRSPTSPAGLLGSGSKGPGPKQYRGRTSSMPAVPRHRPMLADTKRGVGSEPEAGVEYYRLRSFSITADGVYNLGDLLKSRRRSRVNSITTGTPTNTRCSSTLEITLPSLVSRVSDIETEIDSDNERVSTYKVGMLGASGVGKTALIAQFTTSDYICAYDASLDEECGQKSVSVMLDGQETELEVIDHPAAEMSVEAFCSTYNPDVYVVVYSVVDAASFKAAEETLLYLRENDYMASHAVILVGNKVDLERIRKVPTLSGSDLAERCGCKFIETSSGLAHHVDELLVGILAQIKLDPQREWHEINRRNRRRSRWRFREHLLS